MNESVEGDFLSSLTVHLYQYYAPVWLSMFPILSFLPFFPVFILMMSTILKIRDSIRTQKSRMEAEGRISPMIQFERIRQCKRAEDPKDDRRMGCPDTDSRAVMQLGKPMAKPENQAAREQIQEQQNWKR